MTTPDMSARCLSIALDSFSRVAAQSILCSALRVVRQLHANKFHSVGRVHLFREPQPTTPPKRTMASDFAGIEDEAARIIQSLRKRFSSQALSASTLGLVVNGLVITGVVPGGPADKYDHTVPLEKRIEAHDTILTVDGESATEANILRLLRGDGTVGSSAVITVQKFGRGGDSPSSLSPRGARDVVQVTLHRDYKWWVEGMRDVAVAVEQVSFDMGGSISDRSNDEGLMHTVWQMEVNKQLRKLSSLSGESQKNLRAHIDSLEQALTSALNNAYNERRSVEAQLMAERDEAVSLAARLQQEQRGHLSDPAVAERYRDMISGVQQQLQMAEAKNVDLVNQMHSLRVEHERDFAALTDSHSMETRAAFHTVREVEEVNSRALAAMKQAFRALEPLLAAMEDHDAQDARALELVQRMTEGMEALKRRAEGAERRDLETSQEMQVALREVERLRAADEEQMQRLAKGCDDVFRLEAELLQAERAHKALSDECQELVHQVEKLNGDKTDLQHKVGAAIECNNYLSEQNQALKDAVMALETKASANNWEVEQLRERTRTYENVHAQQQQLLHEAQASAADAALRVAGAASEKDQAAQTLKMLQEHLAASKLAVEAEKSQRVRAERARHALQAAMEKQQQARTGVDETVEKLRAEAKEFKAKHDAAQGQCRMLERDLQLALQETTAQSSALNRLTSHVLQQHRGGATNGSHALGDEAGGDAAGGNRLAAPDRQERASATTVAARVWSLSAPLFRLASLHSRHSAQEKAGETLDAAPVVVRICPACEEARREGTLRQPSKVADGGGESADGGMDVSGVGVSVGVSVGVEALGDGKRGGGSSGWRSRIGGPVSVRDKRMPILNRPWSMLDTDREVEEEVEEEEAITGHIKKDSITPRTTSSRGDHPLTSIMNRLTSTRPQSDEAVNHYEMYLQAAEDAHRAQEAAEAQIAALVSERDSLAADLKRATRNAAGNGRC